MNRGGAIGRGKRERVVLHLKGMHLVSQESEARQAEVAAVSRKSEATLAALRVDLEAQVKSHSLTAESFSFSARMKER